MSRCWKDYREWLQEEIGEVEGELAFIDERQGGDPYAPTNGRTCLLPDGHAGPHEWTDDSDITVRFR